MCRLGQVAALLCVFNALASGAVARAGLARSAHFAVYAQAGPAEARAVLLDFERLRAYFLQQTGMAIDKRPPVRVIAFQSPQEYARYELQPTADAYYVGSESSDLIVMPAGGYGDIRMAAHEYAHFVLHANALKLPPWLDEGLPEFFSSVRVDGREKHSGSQIPPRSPVLRTRPWMPLAELVRLPADSPLRAERGSADIFYAESWALTDMLMASPLYRGKFADLIGVLKSGAPSDRALATVCGRSLDEITADLRTWVRSRRITPVSLPAVVLSGRETEGAEISELDWRAVLADLLLATGKRDRAAEAYEQLAREAPANPDFPAALATIAIEKHDWSGARGYWQRALDQGIRDAGACYRYAVRASAAGLPGADIEPALERAIAAQPDFDDARFMLATLQSNAGKYESAVAQFRALRVVAPARQFAYWVALADAYNQLGRREEAKAAARSAREHAATEEERAHASQLLEIAETDLDVQFTTDSNGHSRLVATRIPHGQPDWNPFIEPGDRLRRVQGKLNRIDCGGSTTRIIVEIPSGSLTLTIVDPLHVQMRNAPQEFTCGTQPSSAITVVYALRELSGNSEGIVRSIEFN